VSRRVLPEKRKTKLVRACQNVGLLFGLSLNFPYFPSCFSFDLLNLAFELFRFVIRHFTYLFTNFAFCLFASSLYFLFTHMDCHESIRSSFPLSFFIKSAEVIVRLLSMTKQIIPQSVSSGFSWCAHTQTGSTIAANMAEIVTTVTTTRVLLPCRLVTHLHRLRDYRQSRIPIPSLQLQTRRPRTSRLSPSIHQAS